MRQKTKITSSIISEFISGSSTHAVMQGTTKRQLSKAHVSTRVREIITRSGFTLIELLVVVLIMGVLAAIALPQYQKAIDKSHFAQIMPVARDIANAQEVFYLEHGHYASNLEDLPITLTVEDNKNNLYFRHLGPYLTAVYVDSKGVFIAAYTIYYRFRKSGYAGKTYCFTYNTPYRERAKKICQSFGGKLKATASSCTTTDPCEHYFLSNN